MAGKKRNPETPPVKAPRKSRHRELSEEEHKLWQLVTRQANPLPRRRKSIVKAEPEQIVPEEKPETPIRPRVTHAAPTMHETPRPLNIAPPPLTGLDRRTTQRLTRGQIDYEAKLDLHGHNQVEAHSALLAFLSRTRAAGKRCVLVVTGKGESPYSRHTLHGAETWHAPERPGILRSALPRWLSEAEFRTLVAGFQPAHPRHGGGGAFYIWLRRKR